MLKYKNVWKVVEIENFIKKYPDTKDIFEKCGNFSGNNYLILANDNEDNSPLYQLELSLRIIIANKRKIEMILKSKNKLNKKWGLIWE